MIRIRNTVIKNSSNRLARFHICASLKSPALKQKGLSDSGLASPSSGSPDTPFSFAPDAEPLVFSARSDSIVFVTLDDEADEELMVVDEVQGLSLAPLRPLLVALVGGESISNALTYAIVSSVSRVRALSVSVFS